VDKILQKSHRILILAFLFFVSGLIFFLVKFDILNFTRDRGSIGYKVSLSPSGFGNGNINVVAEQPMVLSDYPTPDKFQHFTYSAKNNIIEVNGECRDAYYTILVFPEGVDYRKNPTQARFNTAFPCPKEKIFKRVIDLSLSNLQNENYYIIRAQQGETGSWYEPY